MAVDTRSKRASAIQTLIPYIVAPPAPDSTLDQGDRQHIALSYSGILSAAPVVATPILFAVPLRSTLFTVDARPTLFLVDEP